jgi:hypothetical protein
MYDVLGANHCTGNVTVEATGFNVTCRYLTDFSFKYNFTDQFWLDDVRTAHSAMDSARPW